MMKREQLFSGAGYYRFLVASNVLLHHDASEQAVAALRQHMERHHPAEPINVLDLACGGQPVTIAEVMGRFPERVFRYTGIDVNPDQVALARTGFTFPPNVAQVNLYEGNAWDLQDWEGHPPYHLVFSGMNLHHGTPEEVRFLGSQLRKLLSMDAIFISHDVYRPDDQPYRRRPDTNPDDPEESFRLVSPDRLQGRALESHAERSATSAGEPGWRADYLQQMRRALLARGAHPAGVEETIRHMRQRDYPISTDEFRSIFADLGFHVTVVRFTATREPLGPYVAVCVATLVRGAVHPAAVSA